jgi:hypothetical protein
MLCSTVLSARNDNYVSDLRLFDETLCCSGSAVLCFSGAELPLVYFIRKCYNPSMPITTQNRAKSGQFLPGKSGNPGGRPKDEHRVSELARSYTAEAIETLVDLMRHGKDERVRGTAAQALLDRGWGKAKVEVASSGGGGYLELLRAVNDQIKQEQRLS